MFDPYHRDFVLTSDGLIKNVDLSPSSIQLPAQQLAGTKRLFDEQGHQYILPKMPRTSYQWSDCPQVVERRPADSTSDEPLIDFSIPAQPPSAGIAAKNVDFQGTAHRIEQTVPPVDLLSTPNPGIEIQSVASNPNKIDTSQENLASARIPDHLRDPNLSLSSIFGEGPPGGVGHQPQSRFPGNQNDSATHFDAGMSAIQKLADILNPSQLPSSPAVVPTKLKLPKYDGTSSFKMFRHQFRSIAASSKWSPADRVSQLLASLTPKVLKAVSLPADDEDLSEDSVWDDLGRRYKEDDDYSTIHHSLQNYKQDKGVSYEELGHEILLLLKKLRPNDDQKSRDIAAVDYFKEAVADRYVKEFLRNKKNTNLDEAIEDAKRVYRYKSLSSSRVTWGDHNDRHVRSVGDDPAVMALQKDVQQIKLALIDSNIKDIPSNKEYSSQNYEPYGNFAYRNRGRGRGSGRGGYGNQNYRNQNNFSRDNYRGDGRDRDIARPPNTGNQPRTGDVYVPPSRRDPSPAARPQKAATPPRPGTQIKDQLNRQGPN